MGFNPLTDMMIAFGIVAVIVLTSYFIVGDVEDQEADIKNIEKKEVKK